MYESIVYTYLVLRVLLVGPTRLDDIPHLVDFRIETSDSDGDEGVMGRCGDG